MPVDDAVHAEISQFFDHYADLFDKGPWSKFAELFHSPALSVRANGSVSLLKTAAEAQAFFESVSEDWKKEGYQYFRISNMTVVGMGSQSRWATFTWHMHSQDGKEIKRWRQSYQLIRADKQWRVLSSTFHLEGDR